MLQSYSPGERSSTAVSSSNDIVVLWDVGELRGQSHSERVRRARERDAEPEPPSGWLGFLSIGSTVLEESLAAGTD